MQQKELTEKAIELLKELISIQSFSSEEDKTADAIENWFKSFNIPFERHLNNVWAVNQHFDESKPTLLLNSHHDTVKPNSAYTKDPFHPHIEDGKLYGCYKKVNTVRHMRYFNPPDIYIYIYI